MFEGMSKRILFLAGFFLLAFYLLGQIDPMRIAGNLGAANFASFTKYFVFAVFALVLGREFLKNLQADKGKKDEISSPVNTPYDPGVAQDVTFTSAKGMNQKTIEDVEKLASLQTELFHHGKEAVGIIVRGIDTGILADGDNPLMQFEVDVFPESDSMFRVTVGAPILRASLRKYTSGKKVKIKYDLNDKSRAALAGPV